jgi:flagellin
MIIQSNLAAQSGLRMLEESNRNLTKSLSRISTGSKLVSPGDDAAATAMSLRFEAQAVRNTAALANVQNAISFSQTQEGYLKRIGDTLKRMGELTVLAQDGTKSNDDRNLYDKEFQSLASAIGNFTSKEFNGVSLFGGGGVHLTADGDGQQFQLSGIGGNYLSTQGTTYAYPAANATLSSLSSTFTQYGSNGFGLSNPDNSSAGNYGWFGSTATVQDFVDLFNSNGPLSAASYDSSTGQLSFTVNSGKLLYDQNNTLVGLGFTGGNLQVNGNMLYGDGTSSSLTFSTTLAQLPPLNLTTASNAASALARVNSAIQQLAADRATVGANMARLNATVDELGMRGEELAAANSRIKDVDVAEESTNLARSGILVQAGTAMLSQANAMPKNVLQLLG